MYHFSEEENKKLLLFHAITTAGYLFLLILLLVLTGHTYLIGKYSFQFFLMFIVASECLKLHISNRYFNPTSYCIGKKSESFKGSKMSRIINHNKSKDSVNIIMHILALAAVYFVISIVYGADVSRGHEESLMFSALLSILTALPTCLQGGCSSFWQILLGLKPSTKLEAYWSQNVYFTLGGAWVGAMAIPLDWDRPWQVWPIPCSYGSIIGCFSSQVIYIYKFMR